jgi:hypothetical protein
MIYLYASRRRFVRIALRVQEEEKTAGRYARGSVGCKKTNGELERPAG